MGGAGARCPSCRAISSPMRAPRRQSWTARDAPGRPKGSSGTARSNRRSRYDAFSLHLFDVFFSFYSFSRSRLHGYVGIRLLRDLQPFFSICNHLTQYRRTGPSLTVQAYWNISQYRCTESILCQLSQPVQTFCI